MFSEFSKVSEGMNKIKMRVLIKVDSSHFMFQYWKKTEPIIIIQIKFNFFAPFTKPIRNALK